MGKQRRNRLLMVLLAAVVWVGAVFYVGYTLVPAHVYWGEPDIARQARDTQALRAVLPVLEELKVTDYSSVDGCQSISSSKGHWSNPPEGCYLYGPAPASLPFQDRAAFARVKAALDGSGVWVDSLGAVKIDSDGKLRSVAFNLTSGLFSTGTIWSYVYDPGYSLPESSPYGATYRAIDSDWYFVSDATYSD